MSRTRIALAGLVAILLPLAASAQEAEQPALDTDLSRTSYAIGVGFARSMAQQGVEVDMDVLMAGIQDGLAETVRIPDEEMNQIMVQLRSQVVERMQAKRQAALTENLAAAEAFLAENGKRPEVITLPSGLEYEVLQSGDGPSPEPGSTVKVHYHGTLIDGTVFDSSVDRGEPVDIPLDRVIAGWSEAIPRMSVGDKWKLYIPPALGYGEQGGGNAIPANSALIFEVELLGLVDEEAAGGEG